jgi:P2 family phage contractile tail tube protein
MDSIIRGANWYVDKLNQRLRLDEVRLPRLRREMTQYMMGGSYFGLELPAEISPLSAEASYNGSHADVRSLFGREPGDWTTCYYYESLLNVFPKGGDASAGKPQLKGRVVILKGLLTEVEQPAVKGLKPSGQTRFTWSSIITYQDVVDGKTIHKFDVENNVLIINGANYTAEHNSLIAA